MFVTTGCRDRVRRLAVEGIPQRATSRSRHGDHSSSTWVCQPRAVLEAPAESVLAAFPGADVQPAGDGLVRAILPAGTGPDAAGALARERGWALRELHELASLEDGFCHLIGKGPLK